MSGFSDQYKYQEAQQAALAASIHVGALVKVISFDPSSMTVNVKPLVQSEYTAGSQVLGVPVAGTRGGGFLFRPCFRSGDIGVVLYLDHDMDEVMAKGGEAASNTERGHSENDAVFVGGIVAGGWNSPGLPEGIVLGTEDGAVYLAVTPSGVVIKGTLTVDGNAVGK